MLINSAPVVIALGLWERVLPNNIEKCRIHSKFETVVNLEFKGRLITLQAPNRDLTPFGIRFTSFDLFKTFISGLSQVTISKKSIKNSKLTYILDKTKKINLKLSVNKVFNHDSIQNLRCVLQENLDLLENRGGKYDFTASLVKWVTESSSPVSEYIPSISKYSLLRKTLSSKILTQNFIQELIGWGIGGTPSGDDFLIGFIMAFFITKLNEHPYFELL
ncbi:MAG: oxamate carbamoyltransferase subunit AllH family protein, partial [Candidatus Hodarchaeales archaeon]